LLLAVGVSMGKEVGFNGAVNLGVGVAYVEIHDRLGNFPVGELTLQGGYNFTKNISFFVNGTYSYLWNNGGMLSQPGFTFGALAGFTFNFTGS
jgi:hypothetical protein